jgi:hypothetical protein
MMSTAALALAAPAAAGESAGFVPQYGGDQFMLFVSKSLGARRSTASTFGIRFERATSVSSDPTMQFCAPLRHHALVELQFKRGAATRVQFGNRVTWDLERRQLAPTAMFNLPWSMPAAAPTGTMPAAWTP